MAYELVAEVLDHAPAMTPAERLVLVVVAEQTRTPGEARAIEHTDMLRRLDIGDRGLRQALARLAARGVDVRVPLGEDKRGRPFYAVPGRSPVYRLPRFPAPAGCRCPSCRVKVEPQFRLDGAKAEPQRRQAEPPFPAGGTTAPGAGTTVPPTPYVEDRPDAHARVTTVTDPRSPHAYEEAPATKGVCQVCEWPEANRRRHPRHLQPRQASA